MSFKKERKWRYIKKPTIDKELAIWKYKYNKAYALIYSTVSE